MYLVFMYLVEFLLVLIVSLVVYMCVFVLDFFEGINAYAQYLYTRISWFTMYNGKIYKKFGICIY